MDYLRCYQVKNRPQILLGFTIGNRDPFDLWYVPLEKVSRMTGLFISGTHLIGKSLVISAKLLSSRFGAYLHPSTHGTHYARTIY